MYNKFIRSATDLVTTHEQIRAGFLSIALEKNMVSDPYVKEALAFKAMVASTTNPEEFINMPEIRTFMLTAAGLSNKSMAYLTEEDQTKAIEKLVEKFLKPAGSDYIDEAVFRFLLIKGDAVGGTMRNRIGAMGQEKLIRCIISCMNIRGMKYDWMANITGSFPWNPMKEDDTGIEKGLKALHWKNKGGDRVLGFNLNISTVQKNVDICLFNSTIDEYNTGKIVKSPERAIMFGELKGGIDPAGADEHWKTANTALGRIRNSFSTVGYPVLTSFVGAAIAEAMAEEIYKQLEDSVLSNVANLTSEEQLVEYCNWLLEL